MGSKCKYMRECFFVHVYIYVLWEKRENEED